jgi:hypothetical protein
MLGLLQSSGMVPASSYNLYSEMRAWTLPRSGFAKFDFNMPITDHITGHLSLMPDYHVFFHWPLEQYLGLAFFSGIVKAQALAVPEVVEEFAPEEDVEIQTA